MTCRQTINRQMLLPRRRVKITPIGASDLLTSEGGIKLKSAGNWWKMILKIKK